MSNSSFIVLSAILFVTSLYVYKKTNPSKVSMGLFYIMAFSSMLLFIAYGVAYYFTGHGINEATIYHLKYGLDGAGFLEYSWLIFVIISALMLGAVYLLLPNSKRTNDRRYRIINSLLLYSALSISLLLNPASIDIYNLQAKSLLFTEPLNSQVPTDFYDYYRNPHIKTSRNNQKNIVFIYAESLERTYFDETLFPGLIKGLRELESNSTYFTNIKQVTGTGWTVGGMTASQCGIPLFTPSHGNSMFGMDQFLPYAVCLGDLLNDKGYLLNYMGGASLDFAGKGKLFKTHGFTGVFGRDELLPELDDGKYKTAWGLYDDSLFNILYRRFTELSETGEKFGLFALTLDTHHPNGHLSKSCEKVKYKDGSNPILNAVACSDYLITNFIKKIIHSPYSNKTLIVLVSDHLAMRNTAYDLLQKKDRKNLFMIIDPGINDRVEIKSTGSTLDIGATLLSFIGFTGDIGLGRNLLIDTGGEEDRTYIHANLIKWKQFITKFWDFPKIQNSLEIDIDKKTVRIDNRTFQLPILIELNDKLESTLKFQFNRSSVDQKSLVQHRKHLGENKYFLLIDKCKYARKLEETLGEVGLCLLAGQGRKYTKISLLDENVTFTSDEIRQLLGISNQFIVRRVAHAGGAVNNKTNTNSIEALDSNIKKGFRYFEIDFSFTKDGRLVCLHDWKNSFKKSFGFETDEKLTLSEFESLVKNKSELQNCTVTSLADWMNKELSAYIVTDVKDNNIEALKIILETLPEAKDRVIPQIYNPVNLEVVKALGFEKMIWTLYRFAGSNDDVLDWVDKFDYLNAITMPKTRAESSLPRELAAKNIPTYVHTVNTAQEAGKYIIKYGISEIYTDYLKP